MKKKDRRKVTQPHPNTENKNYYFEYTFLKDYKNLM